MSSDEESISLDDICTSYKTTLSIALTTKTTIHPKLDSKAQVKTTKDTRTKEMSFTITADNYLDFLKLLSLQPIDHISVDFNSG